MRVDTVLVREASSLAGRIKSVAPASAALNALVLMSLVGSSAGTASAGSSTSR